MLFFGMLTASRRSAAFFITLGGGIVLALRVVADSIGRTTLIDDALQAAGRVGHFLSWIGDQPGLVIYTGGATALFVGALLLAPWEVLAARILGRHERAGRLAALGAECVEISEVLLKHWANKHGAFPKEVDKVYSLKLSLMGEGFNVPIQSPTVDAPKLDWLFYDLGTYFSLVGTLLADGHIPAAYRAANRDAQRMNNRLNELLSAPTAGQDGDPAPRPQQAPGLEKQP